MATKASRAPTKATSANGKVSSEVLSKTFGEIEAPTLPDDEYDLRVTSAEPSVSAKGNVMVTWRAVVTTGEHEGFSTGNQWIVLSESQANAGRRMVETIMGEVPNTLLNLRDPSEIAESIAELIESAEFTARVKRQHSDDHGDSNRVLVNRRQKTEPDEDK